MTLQENDQNRTKVSSHKPLEGAGGQEGLCSKDLAVYSDRREKGSLGAWQVSITSLMISSLTDDTPCPRKLDM